MRVLIMKGQSQYGGTRQFCDSAAVAFSQRGWRPELLDLAASPRPELLVEQHLRASTPFDLVFSINYAGEFRASDGQTMGELAGCGHVIWHTDYVLRQSARLRGTPASTAVLLVDPTQVDAVRSIYGAGRFRHLGFFPHPAVGEAAPDDADVEAFLAQRPIEILWAGGYQAPTPGWMTESTPAAKVMTEALDLALSVEWMPPHEALDQVLRSRGLDLQDPQFISARESAHLVDAEVRQTRRLRFVEALADSGLRITICGAGWEDQLGRFRNVDYGGPVLMSQVVQLMARSRIVLNTNGNFGAGSHERPFSASLAGAATFSDYSRYYAEVFEPGRNIELFRWQDLNGGIASLAALAADPERCFEYGLRAKAETLAHHTWERRLDQIIAAGEAVRG